MPYFIDRHELCEIATPEEAAQRNLDDLRIQHKYNCRKISYWFDEKLKTAFCLFEAPNKECLITMHNDVHAHIPNKIIEIDRSTVNTFLEQIKCLPAINKIEMPDTSPTFLACNLDFITEHTKPLHLKSIRKNYHSATNKAIKIFDGEILSQFNTFSLIAFQSGSKAIKCALKIHRLFCENNNKRAQLLKIGVSETISDQRQANNVKASIKLAQRLSYISTGIILTTLGVKNRLDRSTSKSILKEDRVKWITPDDVKFINQLLNYMERNWKNPNLHANNFEIQFNCSKSQIYRKLKRLTGQSPNSFIKVYRLNRASELLLQKKGNISEIAFDIGFNSASYFSKCFQKAYGIKPSQYIAELTQ